MKQFRRSSFSRALLFATCGAVWACGNESDGAAPQAAAEAVPTPGNTTDAAPSTTATPIADGKVDAVNGTEPVASDRSDVNTVENPDVVECEARETGPVQEWMTEPVDLPWGGFVAMSPEGNGLELTHVDFSTSFLAVPSAGPCDDAILSPDQLMDALLEFNQRSNQLFFGEVMPDLGSENWVGKALANHYLREMVSGAVAQSYLDLRSEHADAFYMKMEDPSAGTALEGLRDSLEDDDPAKAFLDVILASPLDAEGIAERDERAHERADRAGNRHATIAAAIALLLEGGTRTDGMYDENEGDDPRDTPPWMIYGEELDDGLNYEIASKFYRVEAMSLTPISLKEELLFQGNSILTLPNHRENYGVQYFKQFGGTAADSLTDYNPPRRSFPKADPIDDYPWYHHIPGDQDWASYNLVGHFTEQDLGESDKWRERLKVASNLIKKGLEKAGDAAVGYLTGGALGSAGSLIGGAVGLTDTEVEAQVARLEEQINKQYDKKKDETIEDITELMIDELAKFLGDDPLTPELKYKCRVKDLKTGAPRYFCYSQHETYTERDYKNDRFYKPKDSLFRFYSYHYYDEDVAATRNKSDADYRAVIHIILRDAQSRWPAPGFRGDKAQLGADPEHQKLFDPKVQLTVPD